MNRQALDRVTKARIQMLYLHPFYGTLALRLLLVEDENIPTLAVDGTHLFYNPTFVLSLPANIMLAAVAHEVQHCVWDHMGRLQGRKAKKWNYAGDYVINDLLKSIGFTLGNGWLWDAKYPCSMSADEVYHLIPDPPEDGGGGGPQDQVLPPQHPGDHQKTKDEWTNAVAQAALAAHQQGKLPAQLERFVKDLLNPVIDWREQLRRYFNARSNTDFSWRRLNRPMQHYGILLPSLYSERMGPLVNGIDVSGSITQQALNAFGSEVAGIKASLNPEKITNIYCDAKVQKVDEFLPEDELTFQLYGGGGTDFRPVFDYIAEHDITPMVLVFFTDGYGTFPTSAPEYDVVWLMTTDVQPPFGDVIRYHDMD